MRDVDFHRSRRVGQLPFLDGRSSLRLIFAIRCGWLLNRHLAEAAPNSAPAQLETYYGDAIRCAIACEA
jgi:hypothetical protein